MSNRRAGASLKGKTEFDKNARAVHEMQPPPIQYAETRIPVSPTKRRINQRHQRVVKRIEEMRRHADRLGLEFDIPASLRRSDARYLEGVSAGLWMKVLAAFASSPLESPYEWWCRLHWQTRERWLDGVGQKTDKSDKTDKLSLLSVSQADIDHTAEEQAEFFKIALPNPRLEAIELRRKSLQRQSA